MFSVLSRKTVVVADSLERVVRRSEHGLDREDVERVRKSLKDLTNGEREVYDAFSK